MKRSIFLACIIAGCVWFNDSTAQVVVTRRPVIYRPRKVVVKPAPVIVPARPVVVVKPAPVIVPARSVVVPRPVIARARVITVARVPPRKRVIIYR